MIFSSMLRTDFWLICIHNILLQIAEKLTVNYSLMYVRVNTEEQLLCK